MDIFDWARMYFPTTFSHPTPDFHRTIAEAVLAGRVGETRGMVFTAPRGHAMSTILTFLVPLYMALERLERTIVVVDSQQRAATCLYDLDMATRDNTALHESYGAERIAAAYRRILFNTPDNLTRGMRGMRDELVIFDEPEEYDRSVPAELVAKRRLALRGAIGGIVLPFASFMVYRGLVAEPDSVLSWLRQPWASKVLPYSHYPAADRSVSSDEATPLWPDRFSLDFLRTVRASMPAADFEREYMCRYVGPVGV